MITLDPRSVDPGSFYSLYIPTIFLEFPKPYTLNPLGFPFKVPLEQERLGSGTNW